MLVDTSVWVDFLRDRDTRAAHGLTAIIDADPTAVVTCAPIAMEVLAGARGEAELAKLEQAVDAFDDLPLDPWADFRAAASISRDLRRAGTPVGSVIDVLIAAVALRHGATVVHRDADFEAIASVTGLRTVSLL